MNSAVSPLKVLHVIPSVAPLRGGPSHAVIEMVAALRKQGVQAEIATTNDNGPETLKVPLHTKAEYKGVPIYFFPRFSPKVNAIREFAFSGAFTQWLWKQARHYDAIHVHAIFSYVSTAAMVIARMQNIPYMVRPLGQLCDWSLSQSAIKKQLYLKLVERANLNRCGCIHLTSIQEKIELSQLSLKARSVVIPHGIELVPIQCNARQQLRQQLDLTLEQPIILFLSRLHPKKGIETLIQALAIIKEYQKFTFVLAGSGEKPYEQKIKKLLEKNELLEHTVMPGFVSGDFKQLLLQGSDLFTLTSHSENFGVCVLEAIAAGLPVIVTEGVALSQTVKDYDLGDVVEQNIDAIASALSARLSTVRLSVDGQQLDMFGRKSRQFITEHYTWDSIATRLIDTYQTLTCQPTILRYA